MFITKYSFFLSSDDVSAKIPYYKSYTKTAIEYNLSNVFYSSDIVHNRTMYSKHVIKNVFIYSQMLKKIQGWEPCLIALLKYHLWNLKKKMCKHCDLLVKILTIHWNSILSSNVLMINDKRLSCVSKYICKLWYLYVTICKQMQIK